MRRPVVAGPGDLEATPRATAHAIAGRKAAEGGARPRRRRARRPAHAAPRSPREGTRRRIDDRTTAWLTALPTTLEPGGMTLVHGSPRDPVWEYVTSTPLARANFAVLETPIALHGHTHIPMAWADRDGLIEAIAPGPGSSFRLDGTPALLNPG